MPWFKVDDRLHSHPKRHAAGLRAMGLWVVAGSWAADNLTDGRIPREVLPALGGKPTDAKALVDAGLWTATKTGWAFHDWDGFQPDAASVLAARDQQSMKGGEGNHRRWHAKRKIKVPGCPWCDSEEPPEH